MSDNVIQASALILMLVSLPLISIGTWNDTAALWWAGLVLLGVGGLIPPVNRYVGDNDNDNNDNGTAEERNDA